MVAAIAAVAMSILRMSSSFASRRENPIVRDSYGKNAADRRRFRERAQALLGRAGSRPEARA